MIINLLLKSNLVAAGISLLLEAKGHKVEIIPKPKEELRNQTELLIIDIECFITADKVVAKYKEKCCRTILLGMFHHIHFLKNFQYPIGFVSLQSKPFALLNTINKIKKDKTYFCFDKRTKEFLQETKLVQQNTLLRGSLKKPLTKTELKILEDISEGYTTEQIAKKSYRSIHTIQNHRKNIKRKFKDEQKLTLSSFSVLHKSSVEALNWITNNEIRKNSYL